MANEATVTASPNGLPGNEGRHTRLGSFVFDLNKPRPGTSQLLTHWFSTNCASRSKKPVSGRYNNSD
jgi:hypothetical protein